MEEPSSDVEATLYLPNEATENEPITSAPHHYDEHLETMEESAQGTHPPPLMPPVPPGGVALVSPEKVQAEVKNILETVANTEDLELTPEENVFLKVLQTDSGHVKKYGIGACEIYMWFNPHLVPVNGSWILPELLSNTTPGERELVSTPQDAVPNVDLVGSLWSKSTVSKEETAEQVHHRGGPLRQRRLSAQQAKYARRHHPLDWRELKGTIDDPYQSHGPRLEALYNAGLEKATGIAFNSFGICGMVVWYAKKGVDQKILTSPEHETYLRRISNLKGAMLATVDSRIKYVDYLADTGKGEEMHSFGADGEPEFEETLSLTEKRDSSLSCRANVLKSLRAWLSKFRGGGAQVPQPSSWSESLFTMLGSFIGFLVIGALYRGVKVLSDDEYFLVLGPFAAIVMLQYGLTGAPAAQPMSVFWGQIIAAVVAMPLTYIPEHILPRWFRMIVTPTLAITVMVKLGVYCPPSAANSIIFAQGEHNWKFMGLTILCSVASFIPAIAYNNLNPKRQYPTFWKLQSPILLLIPEKVRKCFSEKD